MPGPGDYDIGGFNKKQAGIKFTLSKRVGTANQSRNHTPGPGSYCKFDVLEGNGPKYSLGNATRPSAFLNAKTIPGPADYTLRPLIGKDAPKISFTINSKSVMSKSTSAIGPGCYSPSKLTLRQAPQFKVGTAKRMQYISRYAVHPAPTNYSPNYRISKKNQGTVKIGTSLRGQLFIGKDSSPGPIYRIPQLIG